MKCWVCAHVEGVTYRYGGFLLGGGSPIGWHMTGLGDEARRHPHREAVWRNSPLTRGLVEDHLTQCITWTLTAFATPPLSTRVKAHGTSPAGRALSPAALALYRLLWWYGDGSRAPFGQTAEYPTPGKIVRHCSTTPLLNDAATRAQVDAPSPTLLLPAACPLDAYAISLINDRVFDYFITYQSRGRTSQTLFLQRVRVVVKRGDVLTS